LEDGVRAYYGQSKEGKALVFNNQVGYVRVGARVINWVRAVVWGLVVLGVVGFWFLVI
jgi:hypothetical protein